MSLILSKKKLFQGGQVYLDILITVAILAILTHALLTLAIASYELIIFTKARTTAKHLAQEKIELIRNLPYNSVGTINGIPPGSLPQTENISRNGLNYIVNISIVYIDDPFDNLAPADLLPTDYKRTRVDVSWNGLGDSSANPVTLVSDIAPKGIESSVGGGTLSILVFDANALPVSQASVKIIAESVNPPVNLNLSTSSDGRIILPGAPVCSDNCYQITAVKTGYSIDKTYSQEEVSNPIKPHQNVLESQLTEISFAIDKTSALSISSTQNREAGFAPLPNIAFRLRGSKIIGADINDDPVYKYDQNFTTNGLGQTEINNLEWDNYNLMMPAGSNWDIAGINPLNPIFVLADTNPNLSFALSPITANSLLVSFINNASQPIASVSAIFSGSGFEASGSSGLIEDPDYGQVFFPGLISQNYTLEATAAGFLDYSEIINIAGTVNEKVTLEEN